MSDTPTVTLSMFWPLLMQAAENDFNPNRSLRNRSAPGPP